MNPYNGLANEKFWKTAVATRSMFEISNLWNPKFDITQDEKIATFGSCFAQHIGFALKNHGYDWFDGEPAPVGLSDKNKNIYNYGIFSVRTGNIYTASLLLQWLTWVNGKPPPEEYWKNQDLFVDPFRPNIEPGGFESLSELKCSREVSIHRLKAVIETASIFIFTLGLTESWHNRHGEYEYPMCPGTIGGEFDESIHAFENQNYDKVFKALKQCIKSLASINPTIKILLTVSPVPLVATASNQHVLVATISSKSTLRSAVGEIASTYDNVDYFPSYEIINSPAFKGVFFEPNQRSVNSFGVNFVMNSFFSCLINKFGCKNECLNKNESEHNISLEGSVCEEILLEEFRSK